MYAFVCDGENLEQHFPQSATSLTWMSTILLERPMTDAVYFAIHGSWASLLSDSFARTFLHSCEFSAVSVGSSNGAGNRVHFTPKQRNSAAKLLIELDKLSYEMLGLVASGSREFSFRRNRSKTQIDQYTAEIELNELFSHLSNGSHASNQLVAFRELLNRTPPVSLLCCRRLARGV